MGTSPLICYYRIDAPHFVAGLTVDLEKKKVTRAAPICVYMIGWTEERMVAYAKKKGWGLQRFDARELDEEL